MDIIACVSSRLNNSVCPIYHQTDADKDIARFKIALGIRPDRKIIDNDRFRDWSYFKNTCKDQAEFIRIVANMPNHAKLYVSAKQKPLRIPRVKEHDFRHCVLMQFNGVCEEWVQHHIKKCTKIEVPIWFIMSFMPMCPTNEIDTSKIASLFKFFQEHKGFLENRRHEVVAILKQKRFHTKCSDFMELDCALRKQSCINLFSAGSVIGIILAEIDAECFCKDSFVIAEKVVNVSCIHNESLLNDSLLTNEACDLITSGLSGNASLEEHIEALTNQCYQSYIRNVLEPKASMNGYDVNVIINLADDFDSDYFNSDEYLQYLEDVLTTLTDFENQGFEITRMKLDACRVVRDGRYTNFVEGTHGPVPVDGIDTTTNTNIAEVHSFLNYHDESVGFDCPFETRDIFDRYSDLKDALESRNLILRKDSKVCQEYVLDGTYNGPSFNWIKDPLLCAVEIMSEMHFLYKNTNYGELVGGTSEDKKMAAVYDYVYIAKKPIDGIPCRLKKIVETHGENELKTKRGLVLTVNEIESDCYDDSSEYSDDSIV
jgi:hypothetical protein